MEGAFIRDFAGDLPEGKTKVLYAVQEPSHRALLTGKTTQAAWRSKPSFYAVSTEYRTINPDLERFMAKRMGAKTIEVNASHLSLISRPDEITRLILDAAGNPPSSGGSADPVQAPAAATKGRSTRNVWNPLPGAATCATTRALAVAGSQSSPSIVRHEYSTRRDCKPRQIERRRPVLCMYLKTMFRSQIVAF